MNKKTANNSPTINKSQEKKRFYTLIVCFVYSLGIIWGMVSNIHAESAQPMSYTIFDDKLLLEGYTEKYFEEPKEILIAMIKDKNLSAYKSAAAIRVFKEKYSQEVFSKEKRLMEKTLIHRLNRTNSIFVQIEIMHTLCKIDRYKYFKSMVPSLINKLDHYNKTVNEMAYDSLNDIIEEGNHRAREARVVFNILRKNFFIHRKKLKDIKEPGPKLKQKLELLRWSIKILGSQEIRKLPKEVINLL